ncbi:MAG: hypothetical protein M3Q24_02190 [bacterium]|nr:hypothetical protein [bacterium]
MNVNSVVPGAMAMILPVASTAATPGLLDFHVPPEGVEAGEITGVSLNDCPTSNLQSPTGTKVIVTPE